MIPHTLVLKPGLVIHSVYNGYWFWGRPWFYDLWRDLRAATAEIRPDWDLSTPGLHALMNPHSRTWVEAQTALDSLACSGGTTPAHCRPVVSGV